MLPGTEIGSSSPLQSFFRPPFVCAWCTGARQALLSRGHRMTRWQPPLRPRLRCKVITAKLKIFEAILECSGCDKWLLPSPTAVLRCLSRCTRYEHGVRRREMTLVKRRYESRCVGKMSRVCLMARRRVRTLGPKSRPCAPAAEARTS